MKNLVILILLISVTWLSQGQDIVYTVRCEKDGADTKLDSIIFENLSNDSRIVFGALPNQNSYAVNLSLQQIEVNTGLINFTHEDQIFRIARNIPGEISIQCKYNFSEDINLSIFNLNGQKLYSQKIDASLAFNTLDIAIPNSGLYFINLHSSLGNQSFKVMGSGRSGMFSSSTNMNNPETTVISLKSTSFIKESDFSFQQGDSLKVIAYIEGTSTYPITFKANQSDTLNLFFVGENENYMIVNNSKYPLNLGHHVWGNANDCGLNDGSNIYSHGLYLTSDINLKKTVGEGASLRPYGIGNFVVFNMLNRDSVLVAGKYTFINDVDCYGIVSIGDSTFSMSSTDKFVTTKEKSFETHYAFNVDLDIDWDTVDEDNPTEELLTKFTNYANSSILIVDGSVTIEKNNDLYTITIDCIDSNGLRIIGRYSGQLNWILFDV